MAKLIFLGTKGEIEEETARHRLHSSLLVESQGTRLLIDYGLLRRYALEEIAPQDILITHAHPDHYGLADRVRQISGAKISLHYIEKELVFSRFNRTDDLLRQIGEWLHRNGAPENAMPVYRPLSPNMRRLLEPVMPDITLKGGETIPVGEFQLHVIWTPGHSRGHICLYESTHKILFSGDHILPVITPNISLQPETEGNPLGEFLNSLRSLEDLDAGLVLPAHENVFHDLRKRIEEILQHHEQRNTEILATLNDGPQNAYQISTGITWMPELGGVHFQNLSAWNQRSAVLETLAHLEAMTIDHKVDKIANNGIVLYGRPNLKN